MPTIAPISTTATPTAMRMCAKRDSVVDDGRASTKWLDSFTAAIEHLQV
jgi:hypothetical protein